MRAFLDTSVLVATFYGEHQHHEPSFSLFIRQKKTTAYTAAHCLAEVYSVLTGMPGKDKASPDEALLFLRDVRERLTMIALDETEYIKVIEEASGSGICGGAIYDAITGRCAVKAKAEAIYTWNVRHFISLGADVAKRVKTPAADGGAGRL